MTLTGFVYRAHNPRWAFAPDSGHGAALSGGRFNPVGMPALYTSLRFETAWLEAQQAFPFKAQPMTLCAYEVACADVLDLTDAATLAGEGIAGADLACAVEGPVHTRHRAAILGDGAAPGRVGKCGGGRAQLRQGGDGGRYQRGVLRLGTRPAAPGAGSGRRAPAAQGCAFVAVGEVGSRLCLGRCQRKTGCLVPDCECPPGVESGHIRRAGNAADVHLCRLGSSLPTHRESERFVIRLGGG